MEPIATAFAIIQPYTDKNDRLETAIVVSEHGTAQGAFAELERLAARFRRFNLPGNVIEMLVVDALRRPVRRGIDAATRGFVFLDSSISADSFKRYHAHEGLTRMLQQYLNVVSAATRAVPAVRFALGIAGVTAVGAIGTLSFKDAKVAFFVTLAMLALMVLLVVFARVATQSSAANRDQPQPSCGP